MSGEGWGKRFGLFWGVWVAVWDDVRVGSYGAALGALPAQVN